MLRLSFLLLALAACALAASVPAAKEEASSTVAAAAAPKAAPKAVQPATKTQAIYTSKFDNVNLDQILRSERLLNNYFKCLMEKGPCTPDAAELRRKLSKLKFKITTPFPKISLHGIKSCLELKLINI